MRIYFDDSGDENLYTGTQDNECSMDERDDCGDDAS